jgi:Arginine repressor
MQLVKLPSESGGYRYSLPVQKKIDTQKKLQRTLRDAYVSFAVQDQFGF